jgi:Calx-beta domain
LFAWQVTKPEAPTTMKNSLARRPRLTVETFEDRVVPSSLSVSDVTVREGATVTGILDPAGAASVGINGIKGIAFDNGPTDAHYGDLFVAGYLSHSVARFDWASQTYQPFVAPGSGGLNNSGEIAVGPDGNVYVGDNSQSIVFRYDGATGAPLPAPGQTGAVFVNAGANGAGGMQSVAFGPDGNVYLGDGTSNRILEYQGPAGPSPGAFIGVFATVNNDNPVVGLGNPAFGPDGNLYVGAITSDAISQIYRFDGSTGAPLPAPGQSGAVFVPRGSGGLVNGRDIIFDPQGINMYVVTPRTGSELASLLPGETTSQVVRYQGPNGPNPGAYVEAYLTAGQSGVHLGIGIARDATGNMYVSDRDTANVTRIVPASKATFTVTLNSPSTSPVSVDYATANGTAVAGTDYTQTSGTLTFPAGVSSATVTVPITTVATGGPTKTFTLNLSAPVNATVADGTGVGSILNRQTKFFVVDSGTVRTYEYGSGGTSEEITIPQLSSNTAPRGVATTAAGDKVWVVDANKTVFVYNNHGFLLGSWTPGGLSANAQLEGIATNGTDIWLLDNGGDKVYKYTGAASRLSGSQNAANSFNLVNGKNGNSNGKGIVTDGTFFWVVDDSSTDRVFKYKLSGSSFGSWTIDAADSSPTGLTINPSNVSDVWIVDNGTDKVYQYTAAAGRTSGSQSAAATFALNAYDTNPEDIADPPAPGKPPLLDSVANLPVESVGTENLAPRSVPTRTLSPEAVGWLAQNVPVASPPSATTSDKVHDDQTEGVLTGVDGNWFLFNNDGDGGVKDKATDLSTFESQFAQDIDWLNNGL